MTLPGRTWVAVVLGVRLLLGPAAAAAQQAASDGGWEYLIGKLVDDGLDRQRVLRVFGDPRFEPFTGLEFGLLPGEPRSIYRRFLRPASVAAARRCLGTYAGPLAAAQRARGVPATLIAAILHVESSCGHHTGEHPILPRLARLAMATEPATLRRNLDRHLEDGPEAAAADLERRVRQRARALEATFYPEVRATFELADRLQLDPLDVRGSDAGAFGLPQFLPTSYFRYGVDGDGDGRVSLYDPADAIASCANYLAGNGWRPGLSRTGRRSVLWSYNHSAAYVDTVLTLADRLGSPARPVVRVARRSAGTHARVRHTTTQRPARLAHR